MPETIAGAHLRPNHGRPRADCAILNSGVGSEHFYALPHCSPSLCTSAVQRTGVDLNSYADLAVRLVNTTNQGRQRGDGLATVESYRALVTDRPHLAGKVTPGDLEALRLLREELRAIFTAADWADGAQVAARLTPLPTRHPLHPQIVSHPRP